MLPKKTFFQRFWREKKMVGAISPSSSFLTNKMLENIDFNVRESKLPRDLDTRGFEKKLSFLKANVKKSNLNLITNLIESHNQFILSNFID